MEITLALVTGGESAHEPPGERRELKAPHAVA
jgi:hypothetical protein